MGGGDIWPAKRSKIAHNTYKGNRRDLARHACQIVIVIFAVITSVKVRQRISQKLDRQTLFQQKTLLAFRIGGIAASLIRFSQRTADSNQGGRKRCIFSAVDEFRLEINTALLSSSWP